MDLGNKVEKENLVHLRCVHVVTSDMSDFSLCDHMDCSPSASSVHGILQARILEWVAILFSKESFQPRDRTRVSYTAGRLFTIWATREAQANWL